jgi:transporter family protein
MIRGMVQQKWLVYAIFAALSASLVNIFAKVGMEGIDPTLATTVRAAIMLVFLAAVCFGQELWGNLSAIHSKALLMIALSGLAGALSWLFGFKALAVGGQVTQVGPIDKLSVPLAAILAFIILRDRPSGMNWLGIALIAFGAYLTALPRQSRGAQKTTSAAQTQQPDATGDLQS